MSRPRSPFHRSETGFRHIAHVASLGTSRMHLELERIAETLDRLGNPHRHFPAVLVAGTNGKGSVTAYCSAILRAAGLAVGTYYSPHIFRLHERIRCDGAEISSRALDDALGRVRAVGRGAALTYFEYLTAAAALHFAERRVDIAVFEVGLGGRLDATNLVDAAVTVITGISHDHREHLGRTKRRILSEKLGILRPGIPLVATLPTDALAAQARAAAAAVGAPYHDPREEARWAVLERGWGGMTVRLGTCRRDYGDCATRMIGAAQPDNIATAVRAVEVLSDSLASRRAGAERGGGAASPTLDRLARRCAGRITRAAVRAGVAAAFIAGRFQVVSREPLVVLDVSHNEESFLAALETLRRLPSSGPRVIVFGMLAHKELGRFPERAAASADAIVLTRLADRRAASERVLADSFRRFSRRGGGPEIVETRGMRTALRAARRASGETGAILVMGSHVAVEEAAPYI